MLEPVESDPVELLSPAEQADPAATPRHKANPKKSAAFFMELR
jgi:hypothetical protein